MLRGHALAKVDGKGRLKVPAQFRSVIEPKYGTEFFVTSLDGDSVRVYPMKVYRKLEERLIGSSSVKPSVLKLRTLLNSYGQTAVMDQQGRILIHPDLREDAAIDGNVTVLGQQDFLEVWDRTKLSKKLKPLTSKDRVELGEMGF